MKHLFLFFCLLLCSCEYSELEGYCSNPVKLSKEELLFSAERGIDTVAITMNRNIDIIFKNRCERIEVNQSSE